MYYLKQVRGDKERRVRSAFGVGDGGKLRKILRQNRWGPIAQTSQSWTYQAPPAPPINMPPLPNKPPATMIVRTRPNIILFGDSITQLGFSGSSTTSSPGWVSLLSNAYARRADVLNRGYSGYNTRHALDILPSVFSSVDGTQSDSVLMVTVFFGANDASLPGDREHCQHVPINEYERNIRKIVESIQ